MSNSYAYRPLNDALEPAIERISADPSCEYHLAGVYSFGRGVIDRGAMSGSDTKYRILHRLSPGMVVMSKLKAWEGAIAVVSEEFAGYVVSPEFPTYRIRREVLDPAYMRFLCRWKPFWEALQGESQGMGGRRERVNPGRLLDVRVPMPSIAEQRRIVDLLSAYDHVLARARAAVNASAHLLKTLTQHEISRFGTPNTTLGDTVDIIIGRTPPRDQRKYWTADLRRPFCTIADMNGEYIVPSREGITEEALLEGKAKEVPQGALLMSFKLTIGKLAFAGCDLYPNEAIAWLRPKDGRVNIRYLKHALAALDLASGASPAIKGATLNQTSMRFLRVVVPDLDEQQRVADVLDAAAAAAWRTSDYRIALDAARLKLLAALVTGSHWIPASYDRFLLGGAA